MTRGSGQIMSGDEFEGEPLRVEDDWEEFRYDDPDPIGVEELKSLDLAQMPEDLVVRVMDNYFPDTTMGRVRFPFVTGLNQDSRRVFGERSNRCRSRKVRLRRRANCFKPSANVDLGMGFSAEVASSRGIRSFRLPLENTELGITALNHKPVVRAISDPSADFASEFLKRCHAVALAWRQVFHFRVREVLMSHTGRDIPSS